MSLAMVDESAVDTSVFTIDFESPIKSLEIQTSDIAKAGVYDFSVTVTITDISLSSITTTVLDTTTFSI